MITNSQSALSAQRPVPREEDSIGKVVRIMEDLRKKKQLTQDDVCKDIYGSYKHFVRGRIKQVPPRETIRDVGRYLGGTPYELNALFQAAGYPSDPPGLPEDQYQTALLVAKSVLHELPYPAFLGTQGMIHQCNEHFLSLNGMSQVQ